MTPHSRLITAYLVSALLEVAGIILVVLDLREDRKRAHALTILRRPEFRPSTRHNWPDDPRRREKLARQELEEFAKRTKRSDDAQVRVITQMLRGSKRRMIGPVLLVLGVIVGTVANIAAT